MNSFGEDLVLAAERLPDEGVVAVLVARIWRRLTEAERQVLMAVAVYQNTAPADLWKDQTTVVQRLIVRGLLLTDGRGGLSCATFIHPLICERIPPDLQRPLHLQAATALEERGEFVSAMHHYVTGGQPSLAVWLWFGRRTQLIERGQGPTALSLLEQVVAADLPDERDRAALSLALAELFRLIGQPDAMAAALGNLPTGPSGMSTAYAQQLLADALERQGNIEQSLATYRRALETLIGSMPRRQVVIHQKLVYLHLTRLPDLAAAEREAYHALFHAETYAGTVAEFRGDLVTAQERYERALTIAQKVEDNVMLHATIYSHIGKLKLKAGDTAAAIANIRLAMEYSDRRGDLVGPLYDRINLAYALTVQGEYAAARLLAEEGLAPAQRMRHAYLIAGLAAAGGDAAERQGDLGPAEYLATQSLFQEEAAFRPWALTVLGRVQAQQKRFKDAERTLQMAIEEATVQEDDYGEAYAQEALALVLKMVGEQQKSQQALQRSIKLYEAGGFAGDLERLQLLLDQ